jgi:hypothetical protein
LIGVPGKPFTIYDLDFRSDDGAAHAYGAGVLNFTLVLRTDVEPVGYRIDHGQTERISQGPRAATFLARGIATIKGTTVDNFDLTDLRIRPGGDVVESDALSCLSEAVELLTTLAGVTTTIANQVEQESGMIMQQLQAGETATLRAGERTVTIEYDGQPGALGESYEGAEWELDVVLPDGSARNLTCHVSNDPAWSYYGEGYFVQGALALAEEVWSTLINS